MKKEYETPTLETIRFALREVILSSTEGGGGGVDWGDDEKFDNDDLYGP